ncbi:hypothetical protein ACKFKG_15685 [Phormidesmis sp. 146-35]
MSQQSELRDIVGGVFLAFGLNILAVIFFVGMAGLFTNLQLPSIPIIFVYLTFGIGLSQLIYIVPIAVRFARRQQWGRMKGVIIGAVITALLNGSCFYIIGGMRF